MTRIGPAHLPAFLLLFLLPGRAVLAQRVLPLGAPATSLIDDVAGRMARPPAEQLKLEVEWLAKVGRLEPPQTARLFEQGASAIDKRGGLFLQRRGGNERAARRWQIVNGRIQWTQQAFSEPPGHAIRRTLMPLLKEISPDAAARVRAERDLLDSYRKEASVMAEVAAFDECLLLTREQRTQFRQLLGGAASAAWWRPTCPVPTLDTSTHRLLMLLAEGQLGEFDVPEADLAKVLGPSQMAAFKEFRRPAQEEILLSESVPQASAAATLKKQWAAVARGEHAEHRAGKDLDAEKHRLTLALAQWVDYLEEACELGPSQREKLSLAGKLDVERYGQRPVLPQKPVAPDEVLVQTVRFRAEAEHLPPAVFRDEASHFQKALRGLLSEDQKRRLDQSRRESQRRSLVEGVVAGFESSAALTAAQCKELSRLLNEALKDADPPETADWRLELVRRIVDLPRETLQQVLFDFQIDAARRHQQHLAETARQFEESVESVIIQVVRDKQGTVRKIGSLDDGRLGDGRLHGPGNGAQK